MKISDGTAEKSPFQPTTNLNHFRALGWTGYDVNAVALNDEVTVKTRRR